MRSRIYSVLALLCVVTSLAVPSRAAQSDVLTLEDVLKIVLVHNSSLREAEDTIAAFKARVEEAKSALLPHAFGSASYTRLGPVPEIAIPGFGTFSLYPENNYDLHAGLRQLLFDFGRVRESVSLSRSQTEIADDRRELLRRDLEFQTAQLFYAVLFLQEDLRVQTDHIRILNDHLQLAQKKVATGTATELDTLNTQVRVVSAENMKLDLENALEKQVILLRRLMGSEERAPLTLRGEFKREPLSLDADSLVRTALQTRLEARAMQNQTQALRIQSQLADLSDRPTFNLDVLFGTKNGYFPNLNTMRLNYVAAVQADIPLFNGNLTRWMKAEAASNLKAAEDKTKDLEEMIRSEVLQAVADVGTSEQKLRSVEVNITQAQKALEYARTRYEAGTATNLDLLDTEDARSEAEFIRVRALYQFALSRLSLDRAVGNKISH